jgi:hypothetical protein
MNNLPEHPKKEQNKVESVFLRTVLRKDVHDRLKEFAQRFSTGQGNWDFGVAVQILLDFYDESQMGMQADKIDMILHLLSNKGNEEQPKEEEMIELLGGSKISKKG